MNRETLKRLRQDLEDLRLRLDGGAEVGWDRVPADHPKRREVVA